jgi:hypothetical protein
MYFDDNISTIHQCLKGPTPIVSAHCNGFSFFAVFMKVSLAEKNMHIISGF